MGFLSKLKEFMSDSPEQKDTCLKEKRLADMPEMKDESQTEQKKEPLVPQSKKDFIDFSMPDSSLPKFEKSFEELKTGSISAIVKMAILYQNYQESERSEIRKWVGYNISGCDGNVLSEIMLLTEYFFKKDEFQYANRMKDLNDYVEKGSLLANYYMGFFAARPRYDSDKKFNDKIQGNLVESCLERLVKLLENENDEVREAYHMAYGILSHYYLIYTPHIGDSIIKAQHYATIGAKYNDAISFFVLGLMYCVGINHKTYGQIAPVDLEKGIEYLKKSIRHSSLFEIPFNNNIPIAYTMLGEWLIVHREQFDPDLSQARKLFEEIAPYNFGISLMLMSIFYQKGLGGLDKDLFKAVEWKNKAAGAGVDIDPECWYRYSTNYDHYIIQLRDILKRLPQ